jgi:endoglucanase
MNYENGDYTINTAYLDRVEEIVNYALKADLYVIINDHWDGGWWGMFGSATLETREDAYELYRSMWQQIAKRFMHYGDHLLFAGGNEEEHTNLRVNITQNAGEDGTENRMGVKNEQDRLAVRAALQTLRETNITDEQREEADRGVR